MQWWDGNGSGDGGVGSRWGDSGLRGSTGIC